MNDMSAGCGSETMNPNPTTEHVAIENAIDVIIDLRDEVAKLRRTVAAQYGEIGEGITDNMVCRFRNMLERAYPRRGRNESVESWRGKLWAFYCAVDKFLPITTAMADRALGDHEEAEAEFDRTIRGGGILREP